jgi:hypothetical protein
LPSQHENDATVDGFRIRLTRIEVLKPVGSETVADWSASPRELEVARGFSGAVISTALLPFGTYTGVIVHLESGYDLKAWAKLDQSGDGAADFTVWTTPEGIQSVNYAVTDTTGLADYGYYAGGLLLGGVEGESSAESTNFLSPVEIAEGRAIESAVIDIRLDTFRLAKGWDGNANSRGDLFNNSERYPAGEPHFGIGYLPLFALVNQPGTTAHTYEISSSEEFRYGETQLATLIVPSTGVPLFGRVRDRGGMDLNQFLNGFKEDGESLSFLVGDGALAYKMDPADAQHKVTGFALGAPGDAAIEITIEDGPACETSAGKCQGDRTGYIRRIERAD